MPTPPVAEVYDPASNSWTSSEMVMGVADAPATVLSNGQVMISGGDDSFTGYATVQFYDPPSGSWFVGPSMQVARSFHGAARLGNGNVLVAGGYNNSLGSLDIAELYNPTTRTWSYASSMITARSEPVIALMSSGHVLVTGGQLAEYYDPVANLWNSAGSLSQYRTDHTATALATGQVLVAGGFNNGDLATAELYTEVTSPPPTITLSPSSLDNPQIGVAYGETVSASGGTAPYSFTISAGALPAGLVLNASTGAISGTPTAVGSASFTVKATDSSTGSGPFSGTQAYTVTVTQPPLTTVVASVLPGGRSVEVGTPATLFATLLNTGTATAENCEIALTASAPTGLSLGYQTTNPATNAPTGEPNTPAAIAQGGYQSFVLSFTASAPLSVAAEPLDFSCSNTAPAPSTLGVDTVDLTFSSTPITDMVALAATPTNDGTLHLTQNQAGAFAVATVNLGAAGGLIASADTGTATLPLSLSLRQTNPSNGQCLSAPSSAFSVSVGQNATPTFSVFATSTAPIAFAPGRSRIFVRFKDAAGAAHGSTSVAAVAQ